MKARSAFGVTTLSVSNCVDSSARTSCTSEESRVLATICSSASKQLPLPKLDPVEQVQAMPALFRNQSAIRVHETRSVGSEW